MNIILSVPVMQPSDAASVSADTMMNSYRHLSHKKELFSFPTFHSQMMVTVLYASSAVCDMEFSQWSWLPLIKTEYLLGIFMDL